jgi:mono/diheme cytochrome c family protein
MSRHLLHLATAAAMALWPTTPVLAATDGDHDAAALFAANCAVCHGPAGRPDPESAAVKALGVMPANFSDVLFNSREPSTDWFLVVKYGGPVLGFSERMPSFKDLFTDDQILAIIDYIKTLVGVHDYPDGALNFFLPLRTKKAFPEDELVWKFRYAKNGDVDEFKNTFEYERRIGTRFQGVLELNRVAEDGDGDWEALEPGLKYVLLHDAKRGLILTATGQFAVPLISGNPFELLPYLAVGKTLGEHFTFQGSARAKLPADDIDQGSVELSGIVHWTHTIVPRSVFPGLEFTGEVPLDRGSGPDRKDFIQVSVTPQARVGLSKRGHVALNLGVEVPLNDTERFDWRGYAYLIWDFADGPFYDGW